MSGRPDPWLLALAAGAVAAAEGILLLAFWPVEPPKPMMAEGGQGAGSPAATLRGQPSFETYRRVFEQPLFNRDRRPDPPPVPQAAPEPDIAVPEPVAEPPALLDLEGLELVGMALSAEGHVALVRRQGEEGVTRLHRGDAFGRWRVEAVERNAVLFTQGGQSHTLSFRQIR